MSHIKDPYPTLPNTYNWSQTDDQLTVSFLVPENFTKSDADVVIEANYVRAGIKGRPPIIKGKLYSNIRHHESLWQIDKAHNHSGFPSPASSASSFTFVTPNTSPLSSLILPPAPLSEYDTDSTGSLPSPVSLQTSSLLQASSSLQSSSSLQPPSLQHHSLHSSLPSLPTPPANRRYRLLTLHLEKPDDLTWPVLISQGGEGGRFDMDPTSLFYWAKIFERQGDSENSYQYYSHAAEHNHSRSMVRVSQHPKTSSATAFTLLKCAADLTPDPDGTGCHPDPEACLLIGISYAEGATDGVDFVVDPDHGLALSYLQKTVTLVAPHIDFSRPAQSPPDPASPRGLFCRAVRNAAKIHPEDEVAIECRRQGAWCGDAECALEMARAALEGRDAWEAGRWFMRAKRLGADVELPEGVEMVEWDAVKEDEEEKKKRLMMMKKKKRRRRARKLEEEGDDALLWAVGATIVTAGALMGGWYLWKRGKTE